MIELLCPHCEEEIGLDDDAVGEFSCPHCDEDFTWDSSLDEGGSTDFYDWKGFWIGFGIPNLSIILAWGLQILFDDYYSEFIFYLAFIIHIVSILSWITILIHGIRSKNKGMWQGSLVGIAFTPATFILGIIWYVEATNWSMF